jgi:NAD+ diphosphatase
MKMFVWPEANQDFVSSVVPPVDESPAWFFLFQGSKIMARFNADGEFIPVGHDEPLLESLRHDAKHYMGDMAGTHCFAVDVSDVPGEDFVDLRSLFGRIDNLMFSLVARGIQIVDWYQGHQYCGRCGGPNESHGSDRALVCRDCGIHAYPRISPSIIVLIHKGDQVLLARNHRFPEGMYSTLAGFVEPGESIEGTLRREVFEEVGVNVHELEYLGSQSWPFPNSLMLGFHAEYHSGEIVLQEEEIADARWFNVSDLPDIPGNMAISRWLIDTYLNRQGIATS